MEYVTSTGIAAIQGSSSITEDILNVVQIIFFIVTGILAVFTYLGARRTVLQPIRTEVFKQQLNVFSEILVIFNGKDEIQLREYFNFNYLVRINSFYLLDKYAKLYFNINSIEREKEYDNWKNVIFTKKYEEQFFEFRSDGSIFAHDNDIKYTGKSDIDIWNNFIIDKILLPEDLVIAISTIRELAGSALLPSECANYLYQIINTVNDNINSIEELLYEVAAELPNKFRDPKDSNSLDLTWISNSYYKRFHNLDIEVDKLLKYIKGYLEIDKLKN